MMLLNGTRVLIVEDEPVVAFALEDILLELGCTVIGPAVRLMQALELAETVEVDAAILDININAGRSYTVADELKARGVPFLLVTGYGAGGVDPKYAGVTTLRKPYQQSETAAALATLVKGRNEAP